MNDPSSSLCFYFSGFRPSYFLIPCHLIYTPIVSIILIYFRKNNLKSAEITHHFFKSPYYVIANVLWKEMHICRIIVTIHPTICVETAAAGRHSRKRLYHVPSLYPNLYAAAIPMNMMN